MDPLEDAERREWQARLVALPLALVAATVGKALHHVEHVGHVDLGEKSTGRVRKRFTPRALLREKALHHVEHVGHVDLGGRITGRVCCPKNHTCSSWSYADEGVSA